MKRPTLAGLAAPVAGLVAALLAWAAAGPEIAFAVLVLSWAPTIGIHLWNLQRLRDWAAAPLDAPVPEAGGAWRAPFSTLYRRARNRTAHERVLAQTIERFQGVAEAIPDGMVLLDVTNRIRWANQRAQVHLGLDLAHDASRPLANLVRQPEFGRYLDAGNYSDAIVMASHREPGVTLSIQIVPFGLDEKLLISRDITQLEAVARMRRDFIANVSHELKTPLTVVSGFLETLQDLALAPPQQARYLGLMHEQARSMQRLVDDLLTLFALESEQGARPDTLFPIEPVIAELTADARALSAGAHTVVAEVMHPATIRGNRDELKSAFGNLLSNAIRYTPPEGTIDLRWQVNEDGSGDFAVSDTGIGIAAEHLPRLTERFYRVDRSRSRATGGTGLGLAIVKHVLLRHEAELLIDSEPGRGSTFSVRLPARRVTPEDASPAMVTEASRGDTTVAR